MRDRRQLFFRTDEVKLAVEQAAHLNKRLYAIVDKRTRSYRPLMFVVGAENLNQMINARMMRRMWVAVEHRPNVLD